MSITPAVQEDFDRLAAVWEAAVRATHHFLTEDDIAFYRPLVRDQYLSQVELFLARDGNGLAVAFAGVVPSAATGQNTAAKLAMLFVDPACHGKGMGRALVRHAAARYGDLDVDVNEQNPGAVSFYEKCGFTRTGRSGFDDQGRPFPLLHLRRNRDAPE